MNKFYVLSDEIKLAVNQFLSSFHMRWRKGDIDDNDVVRFSSHRQQGANDLLERDIILRHCFFVFLDGKNIKIKSKDTKRAFSELQRISIYRRDKGLCQICLQDGKNEKEALVPWSNYQADHIIPWIKGGQTTEGNAQLLCGYHNQSKGQN